MSEESVLSPSSISIPAWLDGHRIFDTELREVVNRSFETVQQVEVFIDKAQEQSGQTPFSEEDILSLVSLLPFAPEEISRWSRVLGTNPGFHQMFAKGDGRDAAIREATVALKEYLSAAVPVKYVEDHPMFGGWPHRAMVAGWRGNITHQLVKDCLTKSRYFSHYALLPQRPAGEEAVTLMDRFIRAGIPFEYLEEMPADFSLLFIRTAYDMRLSTEVIAARHDNTPGVYEPGVIPQLEASILEEADSLGGGEFWNLLHESRF